MNLERWLDHALLDGETPLCAVTTRHGNARWVATNRRVLFVRHVDPGLALGDIAYNEIRRCAMSRSISGQVVTIHAHRRYAFHPASQDQGRRFIEVVRAQATLYSNLLGAPS